MDYILQKARDAGLHEKCFTKEMFFYAWIYREIISVMAIHFTDHNYNLKKVEYTLDDQGENVKEVILLSEFYRLSLGLEGFRTFLLRYGAMIPRQLRDMFTVSVGYNYGDNGALVITSGDVVHISQEKFMSEESSGVLTDEVTDVNVYKNRVQFRQVLEATLEETMLDSDLAYMNEAARMIEIDGLEAYQAICDRYGNEWATLLSVAHLRRQLGSCETYPPDPSIDEKVIALMKGK